MRERSAPIAMYRTYPPDVAAGRVQCSPFLSAARSTLIVRVFAPKWNAFRSRASSWTESEDEAVLGWWAVSPSRPISTPLTRKEAETLGAILLLSGHEAASGLHDRYGLLPVGVSLLAEAVRAGAAEAGARRLGLRVAAHRAPAGDRDGDCCASNRDHGGSGVRDR